MMSSGLIRCSRASLRISRHQRSILGSLRVNNHHQSRSLLRCLHSTAKRRRKSTPSCRPPGCRGRRSPTSGVPASSQPPDMTERHRTGSSRCPVSHSVKSRAVFRSNSAPLPIVPSSREASDQLPSSRCFASFFISARFASHSSIVTSSFQMKSNQFSERKS